ncbi:hypothetical protein [Ancylobacter defluvii]|uniref:Uncharacterized protein n=1 Tax=Ancylobacter defluvii TaxID=1282440 RepID=A0A9W6JZ15_9HYPH|nr:hypothetical protein [Ancylobacter defluvii]MBS7588144.1 hypothetical protein [Ancylobacter defluvii]GLK86536.1 hypothetical protein GCM10017653_46060 [Ancylobacter defluvii]
MPPRTLRTEKAGKKELRLVLDGNVYVGLVDGHRLADGEDADEVWSNLRRNVGVADPRYFGYSGAINHFRRFFPNGFASQGFASQERGDKIVALDELSRNVPLVAAVDGTGLAEAVLAVFRRTNLPGKFEQIWVQNLLRSADADRFIQFSARFALEPSRKHLAELATCAKPHKAATWPILTYLPFFWQPERHMFLKPEVTREYAARVGHIFAELYASPPDFPTYEALLDLVDVTRRKIGELDQRDGIDIQGFIWVVGGGYRESDGVYP